MRGWNTLTQTDLADPRDRQNALRKAEDAQRNKGEVLRAAYLQGECEKAFLGIADVNVVAEGPLLAFRTYNPTRPTCTETVSNIVKMMEAGECHNRSNPIVVAINREAIELECLTKPHDAAHLSTTKTAIFTSTSPRLEVLAGVHRILASRRASARLQSEVLLLKDVLQNVKDSVEEARDDGDADYDPEAEGRANEAAVKESALRTVTVLGSKISVKQETVEMASVWPVYFYDLGQYSHPPEHEPVADGSLSTDVLRQRGREAKPEKDGGAANSEVLLRFLTKNTTQPRSTRTSNERLSEILDRNLHSPAPAEAWSHLVGDNRTVQTVCNRAHVWTMATTAVQVSNKMHKCWVTNAQEISKISSDPSFRVGVLSRLDPWRTTHEPCFDGTDPDHHRYTYAQEDQDALRAYSRATRHAVEQRPCDTT